MLKVICDYFCEYPQKFPRVEEAFFEMIKENKPEDIANLNVREVKYQLPLPIIKQRQFVFCMCNECDKLNMWNYYVNNGVYQGYNIGFNVQELIRSFDVEEDILDSFLVYYGNVLYKKAEHYKFLKNRFEKLEEVHKNDENLNHLTINLKMFIDSFCAFFKHPKFEDEKEFRIVIEIADARIPRTDKMTKDNLYACSIERPLIFSVFEKDTDEMVGVIGFHHYDRRRKKASAQWYIFKPYRNHGYAKEAFTALAKRIFNGKISEFVESSWTNKFRKRSVNLDFI